MSYQHAQIQNRLNRGGVGQSRYFVVLLQAAYLPQVNRPPNPLFPSFLDYFHFFCGLCPILINIERTLKSRVFLKSSKI